MNGALLTDVCAQLQASDDDVRIAALKALTADDCISPAVRLRSAAMRTSSSLAWSCAHTSVNSAPLLRYTLSTGK